MGIENIDKIFKPKSVAVVGASNKPGSIGNAIMRNLIHADFKGEIYPINPNHRHIHHIPTHPSLMEIESAPDLVIIATPMATVPKIVGECAKTGVKGAIVISAGGKEIGPKGKEMENAIKKEAEGSGLRIIGPNCIGVLSPHCRLNASFANRMPIPGKMAFISQSGAICTAILDLSVREQMGFSYFISLGSMLDVDFGDVIDYLGGEPGVGSIVMYVESLTRFRNFMSAARSVSRVKPIIVYKAGRSKSGAAAAASHTGALAGEDMVYESAFKRAGILRVKTFEELFDCAELLAKEPRPSGPGLAIITNAGGPGVMAVDALAYYGSEPVKLNQDTIGKLNEILPPHWSHGNPIDILGDASPERFRKAAEIVIEAPEVNGLLIMLAPQALTDPTDVAKELVNVLTQKRIPIFTSWMGGSDVEKGREILNQAGIITFDTSERAVRAFMDLYRYSRNIEMLHEIPPKLPKRLSFDREKASAIIREGLEKRDNGLLTETEAKDLLSAYGIPVNPTVIAASEEEAVERARELGFPVAMKIMSPDITHKSDVGGVRLNLRSEGDARNAFARIMADAHSHDPNARLDGVTIQPMLKRPDYELIMGVKKDRDFGPVVLFGMGGIMTEVLKDRSIALPPLNRLLARRLMEETKVFTILKGYRNRPPANLVLLEEILIRLAQLATDYSEIEELDINPLLVVDERVYAADARVMLKPSPVKAPLHLVISPYPNQYEGKAKTKEGVNLNIRPIRPEDAPLFTELFNALSQRSVYNRFFIPVKQLTTDMLVRHTQVDYDRQIALVATHEPTEKRDGEEMLGVARIISARTPKYAEFSVLVRDAWQGKGVGAELLKRCLEIAKDRGIEEIWGSVLAENTQMLALGRKLGFKIEKVPDCAEYELSVTL